MITLYLILAVALLMLGYGRLVSVSKKRREIKKREVAEIMRQFRASERGEDYKPSAIVGLDAGEPQSNDTQNGKLTFWLADAAKGLIRAVTPTKRGLAHKLKGTYEIDYVDAMGQPSQRTITIKKVYRNGGTAYIDAYCHLRNDKRTFVMSRIVGAMLNTKTGETILPYELLPGSDQLDTAKKDAWEEFHAEIDFPLKQNATFDFEYIDTAGNRTQRTVEIKQFGHAPVGAKIYGYCHLRQGNRAFRLSNIRHCVDVETGEIIDDVTKYLEDRYKASSEYTMDILFENHEDVVLALLFVAKADGRVMKPELTVIKSFFQRLCNDPRITEELVKDLYKNLSVPTATQFSKIVTRLKNKEGTLKAEILETAEAIVATQKSVHPVEQFALDLMKNSF